MVEISKQDAEWLIKHNYLKCVHGQYPDLIITSKRKRANGKQRRIPEPIAEMLNFRVTKDQFNKD